MSRSKQPRAFLLRDGQIHEAVDAVRLAVIDKEKRLKSTIWRFWASKRGPDFYVTSGMLKSDMKASIHPTVAQFSYLAGFVPDMTSDKWVGAPISSRHIQRMDLPAMDMGESLHVFSVQLPGFGLRRGGDAWQWSGPIGLLDAYPPNELVTFDLVLVQGPWEPFAVPADGRAAIGLLVGHDGRHAVIFIRRQRIENPLERMEWIEQQLSQTKFKGEPIDDLCLLLWMNREPNQALTMIETHNIEARPEADVEAIKQSRAAGRKASGPKPFEQPPN